MTVGIGDTGLEPHAGPDDLLIPVWVAHGDLNMPGVLLRWEQRTGSWWGLVAWELDLAQQRVWLPAGLIRRVYPIRGEAPPGFRDAT